MDLNKYLTEVFDEKVMVKKFSDILKIPMFLTNEYEFFESILQDNLYILLRIQSKRILIDKLQKHILKLRELGIERPVFVLEDMRASQRKLFVANRLAFIVPGKQIYLPFICLDFNEKITLKPTKTEKFTTVTQCVYLYILNQAEKDVNTRQITESLGIAQISANRAIRQLVSLGAIVESGSTTRKRYNIISKMDLWKKGKDYLINPVQKKIYLSEKPKGIDLYLSNQSALAELSMIGAPHTESYAIYKIDLEKIKKETIIPDYEVDSKLYLVIEVWRYQPGLFTDKNIVDIFSLYAEFRGQDDPRIEIEFEQLLEEALCEV